MSYLTWIIAATEAGGESINPLAGFWMFIPLILIFWLLIFRPQKKERQRRQQMIENIRKGDKVVTIGGVHGVVKKIEDSEVVLAIDAEAKDKVRVRISKSAVHDVKTSGEEADAPSEIPDQES